ncbi:hypothetical protein F511_19059 [Dorcoceras hygrometricum]|uniref:Reverse transcriptase Ty1/copia-type domain-containing protein n=1 Tax=Dorcoceras hygrometricum TaxID=472368 RepID=A0A2Z7C9C0_9LAMI|nr:hypothetical protein F511_19059 [Dorcoceras hygrometricum]
MSAINHVRSFLSSKFDMKFLGDAKKILGMNIIRNRGNSTICLNQTSYIEKVLNKFGMASATAVNVPLAAHFMLNKEQCPKSETDINSMRNVPYSNAIGSVMYMMVSTRPDIAYSVSCLSRYMANPGVVHWNAVKWLLRYLKHSLNYGLMFSKCDKGVELTAM